MPIQTPYYNLHQINVGLYTAGNEFVFDDGSEYVGLYHETPNGQKFSGSRPEKSSKLLLPKRFNQTNDGLVYNKIQKINYPNYVTPYEVVPIPTPDDYKRGNIERFFIQKRNSPQNSITEIDFQQFNTINTTNKPGINGVIWNKCKLTWVISKIPMPDAQYINNFTVLSNLQKFPHLDKFLPNKLEFYK